MRLIPEQNPFDLPELRLQIVQYLEQNDFKACTLVCKTWYHDCQPELWSSFSLNKAISRAKRSTGRLDAELLSFLHKKAHWFKHLHFDSFFDDEFTNEAIPPALCAALHLRCRSLVSLVVSVFNVDTWQAFINLVGVNNGLREVNLYRSYLSGTFDRMMDRHLPSLLARNPHLRSLRLASSMTIADLYGIIASCPELETVRILDDLGLYQQLQDAHVIGGNKMDEGVIAHDNKEKDIWASLPTGPQSHLKQLLLMGRCTDPALGKLLERCTSLEYLGFGDLTEVCSAGVCDLLRSNHLPFLSTLHLGGSHRGYPIYVGDMLHALPAQRLRDVCFPCDPNEVQLLISSHHKTLERVNISYDHPDEQVSLADFFFRCPRLENLIIDLHGDMLDVRHLLRKPWVCTNLQILHIALILRQQCDIELSSQVPSLASYAQDEKDQLAPGRDEWQQAEIAFMARLGKLTRLKRILLFSHPHLAPRRNNSRLSFGLSGGLTYLTGLSQLEILDLGFAPYVQGITELQFMKDHWPKLKYLCFAEYNKVPELASWLQENWPVLLLTMPGYYPKELPLQK